MGPFSGPARASRIRFWPTGSSRDWRLRLGARGGYAVQH